MATLTRPRPPVSPAASSLLSFVRGFSSHWPVSAFVPFALGVRLKAVIAGPQQEAHPPRFYSFRSQIQVLGPLWADFCVWRKAEVQPPAGLLGVPPSHPICTLGSLPERIGRR